MKSGNFKGSPRKKVCRSHKYFNIDHFKIASQENLIDLENDVYSTSSSAFRILLVEHAPLKRKYLDTTIKPLYQKN